MKHAAPLLRRPRSLTGAGALLAALLLVACADTPPSSVLLDARRCTSDDDCTRRELCIEERCVTTTVDGDVGEPDAQDDPDSEPEVDAEVGGDDVDVDPPDVAPDVDPSCGEPCGEGEVCRDGRCFCVEGAELPCGTKVGECDYGAYVCRDGQWSACEGGILPSAEACDGLDNDCDARVDENVTHTIYGDADGDGFGNPNVSSTGCAPADGQSDQAGDCDDDAPTTHPEAAEGCDGDDNDCDDEIDEGVLNACSACGDPPVEVCDGDDNDCDSVTDEGCVCVVGTTEACGLDLGRCRPGLRTCTPEGWGDCEGRVEAIAELCNGEDDDCDSVMDEGVLNTCGTCGAPPAEVCDGVDNDCDGMTDEGACAPPQVLCPAVQTITLGDTAALPGAGSDPDGGALTFAWSVVSAPPGAQAAPVPADAAEAALTPDQLGAWRLRLCGTDDEQVEACCEATVNAASPCTPPPTAGLTACPTSWDRRPLLEFRPLPVGIQYELRVRESGAPLATIEQVGQNWWRAEAPIGPGNPPPGAPVTIGARACRADNPTCCSAEEVALVALIEECTTPLAPTADNIIISEYLINGDGGVCPGPSCEAGEAVEITNLSHCPISLDNTHFRYCNRDDCSSAIRYMNFGPADVIPPRGVFVSIRNPGASLCGFDFLPASSTPGIFGIRRSTLELQFESINNDNGWFSNNGGGRLRLATGAYTGASSGTTLIEITNYIGNQRNCESVGFDALNACGDIPGEAFPTTELPTNQLGRLWHPCDAVVNPNPPACFE